MFQNSNWPLHSLSNYSLFFSIRYITSHRPCTTDPDTSRNRYSSTTAVFIIGPVAVAVTKVSIFKDP